MPVSNLKKNSQNGELYASICSVCELKLLLAMSVNKGYCSHQPLQLSTTVSPEGIQDENRGPVIRSSDILQPPQLPPLHPQVTQDEKTQDNRLDGGGTYQKNDFSETRLLYGLPWWLRWQRICLQCRSLRFDPWVGKIPGEGNGDSLQYSCLENSMDRGTWQTTVHGVAKSQPLLNG